LHFDFFFVFNLFHDVAGLKEKIFNMLQMQHDVALPRNPPNIPGAYSMFMKETLAAGSDGITQEELANRSGLNRITIYRVAQKAQSEKKVRIINDGKNTKYIPLADVIVDPEVGSFLQGREILRAVIRDTGLQPIDPQRIGAGFFDKLTPEELAIFLFSVRVGLSFTFIILQAMTMGNPVLRRSYRSKARPLTEAQKDELLRDWIRGASSSALQLLPYEFKDLAYRVTGRIPRDFDKRVKLMYKRPRLLLDGKVAQEMLQAFADLFPQADKRLRDAAGRLPKAVGREKEFLARSEDFPKRCSPATSTDSNAGQGSGREQTSAHNHEFIVFKVDSRGKHKRCKLCETVTTEPIVSIKEDA
jgi:hypothetical protein